MTDLRQAAQQALEALEGLFGLTSKWENGGVVVWRLGGSSEPRQAITALKAALEQQVEPVAWMDREGDLYKMPEIKNWAPPHTMLYTTPPQRPWVGLTDEDFLEACQLAEHGNYLVAFQRIQTKLKEKNDH